MAMAATIELDDRSIAATLDCGGPRWYDPTVGRWLSEDPSGLAVDADPYRYVGNSPTDEADPSGLASPDQVPDKLGVRLKMQNGVVKLKSVEFEEVVGEVTLDDAQKIEVKPPSWEGTFKKWKEQSKKFFEDQAKGVIDKLLELVALPTIKEIETAAKEVSASAGLGLSLCEGKLFVKSVAIRATVRVTYEEQTLDRPLNESDIGWSEWKEASSKFDMKLALTDDIHMDATHIEQLAKIMADLTEHAKNVVLSGRVLQEAESQVPNLIIAGGGVIMPQP
jgi:hypothetical protein